MRRKKMVVYLQIIEEKIVSVDTENSFVSDKKIECYTLDEFYSKAEQEGELTEEADEQIKEFFDEEKEEESLSNYQIKHWVSNRSFGELIDMYECGEIKKPAMQREFVWDSSKSSRLIESIILGLPIPPLFLLEVDNNKYELIDGYQRLTTVTNFVKGYPWNNSIERKHKVTSKLSGNIKKELIGSTFEKLSEENKRKIKRSTIPLIEFRQIQPDDMNSKYLIFERINTGSEKLNSMQIRKSLAYGKFIEDLYKNANRCEELKSLFSVSAIKKDNHVEAFLRTYAMIEIVYKGYNFERTGLNHILNSFCEKYKNSCIDESFYIQFQNSLKLMEEVFIDKKNMFKRVEKDSTGNYIFVGNMNVSIMEALLGVSIHYQKTIENTEIKKIKDNYCDIMYDLIQNSIVKKEDNPFSTSTGTKNAIQKRFLICEKILGIK